jgi:hypothetical protein
VGLFNTAMHSLERSFLKKDMRLILYRSTPSSNQLSNAYLIKCKHPMRNCALLDPTKLLGIFRLRESYRMEGLQVSKNCNFNKLGLASKLYK